MLLLLSLAALAAPPVLDVVEATSTHRAQRLSRSAPVIPTTAYERAAAGEVVSGVVFEEGQSVGKGWGVAVWEVPVEAAWMALNDEMSYPTRCSSPDASLVVRGAPTASGRLLFERVDLPVVGGRWWIVDTRHNAALYQSSGGLLWEQAWTDATDPANLGAARDLTRRASPVEWTEGAWLLIDLGGATLAEYHTWSDPGGALPAGAASRFAGGAVEDLLEEVGALAEAHARGSREGFVRPDGSPL